MKDVFQILRKHNKVRFSWLPVGNHVPKLSSASVTFYCLSEMTLQLLSERFIFAQPAEMVKVIKFKTYVEKLMVWDTSTRTAVFDDQFTLKVPHDHR